MYIYIFTIVNSRIRVCVYKFTLRYSYFIFIILNMKPVQNLILVLDLYLCIYISKHVSQSLLLQIFNVILPPYDIFP